MTSLQDLSCQQLLADPQRWRNVAAKIKDDWSRCFSEIQNLEKLLEEDRIRRYMWSRRLKIFGWVLSGFQTLVAGCTALLPLSKIQYPDYIPYFLSGATFFLSITLWTQLNAKSYQHLTVAKDAERLEQLCKNVRNILREAISDGRITDQERGLIRDMIGQMHQKAEDISSLGLLMKIFSTDGASTSPPTIFGPRKNNYQVAYEGMNSILDEIKNTQKQISVQLPHVVREYRDSQLQFQIHSSGIQGVTQRVPPQNPVPLPGVFPNTTDLHLRERNPLIVESRSRQNVPPLNPEIVTL